MSSLLSVSVVHSAYIVLLYLCMLKQDSRRTAVTAWFRLSAGQWNQDQQLLLAAHLQYLRGPG